MTLNLINLIRAGGIREAPGQDFRIYGPGSPVTGTKMSDYVIGAMTVTGPLFDILQPEFDQINSGTSFNLEASFSVIGPKFTTIRQNTPFGVLSGWYAYAQSTNGSTTQQVQLTINSLTWGALSTPFNVTITAPYDNASFRTVTAFQPWYRGFEWPNVPSDSATYTVDFMPLFSTPTITGAYDDTNLFIRYVPDAGGFNIEKVAGPYERRVLLRVYPAGTELYEWNYYSSASVNPNSTPDASQVASSYDTDPSTSITLYAWYRLKLLYGGTGTWLNYGAVIWNDSRV